MKITKNYNGLMDLEVWQGATYTKNEILKLGLEDAFDEFIASYFDGIIDEYELNDFLWFERDFILENLGVELDENGEIIKEKLTA